MSKQPGSLLTLNAPGVAWSCVKPAERGEGLIIRTYETRGQKAKGSLALAMRVAEVWETDLAEKPLRKANLKRLTWRPYEVKTLLVR